MYYNPPLPLARRTESRRRRRRARYDNIIYLKRYNKFACTRIRRNKDGYNSDVYMHTQQCRGRTDLI